MGDHTPWARRLSNEVDAFFELWKSRRWLAILFIVVVVVVCIVSTVGWFKRGGQIENLTSDNREQKRDIRLLESENKGLRETVAPLIARAAKEFPGEEINSSLKKIVDRLEEQDPIRRPIASATATVLLTVQSDEKVNSHFMDSGGYAALAHGDTLTLLTSSHESWGQQVGNGVVQYRGVFAMPADSPMVGNSVESLKTSTFLQVEFRVMPTNSLITGGKAIFVINDSTRLEFAIPKQKSDERRVFSRDIKQGLEPLEHKN